MIDLHVQERDIALRVFDAAPLPTAVVDRSGGCLALNAAATDLLVRLGVATESLRPLLDDDQAATLALIAEGAVTATMWEVQRGVGDDAATLAIHTAPLVPGAAALCQIVDVTSERRTQHELAYRAAHDPLTGLPTRAVFLEHLRTAIGRHARMSDVQTGVLFCDLDRLKQVNDTYGHRVGDQMLRAFAERLRGATRPADMVARLAGDEFAVLLDDVADAEAAAKVAERVIAALEAAPFEHAGRRLPLRVSIGIAASGSPDLSADTLLSHADAAMYRAKQRGRGWYALFDEDAYAADTRRRALEERLRLALERDELLLHYQPIVNLVDGGVYGVEALLRWNDPERGVVAAGEFIDVAEDAGLLPAITSRLLVRACHQLNAWDRLLGPDAPGHLFVNLAGSQLADHQLPTVIAEALHATGLAPARLQIEITETAIPDDASTEITVNELRRLGCRLVVDDFGTGYSSLSRLTEIPITGLKIDRSFVRDLASNRESAAIVSSVLLLAHNLRHTVVAEGVETEAELVAVAELGCQFAQGYYICPPRDVDAVTEFLRAKHTYDVASVN